MNLTILLINSSSSRAMLGVVALCAFVLQSCATLDGAGQATLDGAGQATPLRLAVADYPVPVPVALMAFDIDGGPMTIEPSGVRNAAVAAHARWDGATHRMRVGMEVAPLLIGGGVSLEEFLSGRLLRLLTRPRISFAVETVPGTGFHTALGLRWMLHDDADLRADSTLLRALAAVAPADRAALLDSLRPALKEALWNRSVYELALAATWRGHMTDDGSALPLTGYHYFVVAAFPVLGTSGQVQAAASLQHQSLGPSLSDLLEGSLTARMVYGSATERLFVGLRLDADRRMPPDHRVEIGGQLRLGNGIWLRPDIGFSLAGHSPNGPVATLTLLVGTPEVSR